MEGLPVSYSLNSGDNGNNWWGDFIGAAIGGAAGAAWGRGNNNGCCCTTNANIERQGCQTREVILAEGCATRATIRDEQDKTRALISQLDREQLLRESAAKDAKIAQLEAFQFNTALAAGNAQQTRNEMQGQTALILAALRDRTPASSGGASA